LKKTKRQWITDLVPGMQVNILLAVMKIELAKTRSGNDYLKLVLVDKTGSVEGRVWDKELSLELYNTIKQDQVVEVMGEVVDYNGLEQLHIFECKKVAADFYNIEDFVSRTNRDITKMKAELMQIISSIENKEILSYLKNIFLGDFFEIFSTSVGGRLIHHNYLGGLLEHTIEVAGYCSLIYQLQGQHFNRDILIAGAILHDIGKVFEYDKNSITFNITDKAKMLGGHIILGRDFIRQKLPSNFSTEIQEHLEHLILSHHGKKEWGAVVEPQTLEAIALHQADLVSARVNQASLLIEKSKDCHDWTEYDRYLQRSLKLYPKDSIS
jgi:3'-5' exoribonuclease